MTVKKGEKDLTVILGVGLCHYEHIFAAFAVKRQEKTGPTDNVAIQWYVDHPISCHSRRW